MNVIVSVCYTTTVYVVVIIVIGNCAAINIVIGNCATLNVIVGINAGINVIAGTAYCRCTGAIAVASTCVVCVNSAGAVTGTVGVYQCFRIIPALID